MSFLNKIMKNNQPKLKHWPHVIMLFLILCHICAGCCYSYHNLIIMRFESNPNMFDFRIFFLLLAVHDVRVSVFPNMVISDTQQPKHNCCSKVFHVERPIRRRASIKGKNSRGIIVGDCIKAQYVVNMVNF